MYTPKDTEQLKNIVLERKRAEADYHARIREAREEREAERERYNARMKEISGKAQSTDMTPKEAEAKEIVDTFIKNVTSLAKELEEIGIKPNMGYHFILHYGEKIQTNGRPMYYCYDVKYSGAGKDKIPYPKGELRPDEPTISENDTVRNSLNMRVYPSGIYKITDNRFYSDQNKLVQMPIDFSLNIKGLNNITEQEDRLSALKEINENWSKHRQETINQFYNDEKRKLDKINESLDSPDILKTVETAWYEKAPRTFSSRPRRGDRIYIGEKYFEYYGDTEKLKGDTEKPEEEDGLSL